VYGEICAIQAEGDAACAALVVESYDLHGFFYLGFKLVINVSVASACEVVAGSLDSAVSGLAWSVFALFLE
jgi:hypothetical protein